jgi:hypothetical protein
MERSDRHFIASATVERGTFLPRLSYFSISGEEERTPEARKH